MGYEYMRAAITPQLVSFSSSLSSYLSVDILTQGRGRRDPPLIELSRPPTRGPFPPSPRTSGLRGLRSGCGRTSSVLQLRVAKGLAPSRERRATARFGWSSRVRNLPFGVGSVGRAGDPPAGLRPDGGVPPPPTPTLGPSPSGMGGGGGRARAA